MNITIDLVIELNVGVKFMYLTLIPQMDGTDTA